MSSEVEDKIVSIQFDNASFERNMTQTLRSLDKLSESLRFAGAEKGFQNVSNAANNFDVSKMANGIDHIASRFTALGAIGFSVISHLTTSVLDFTRKIGGDILSPIIGGGTSRAKNIEQAKFLFAGLGIDIQKGMDSALAAVKGTAFGLDEAAKTAAQFGASGIKVGEQMTSALRGVAGVAALTGRSFSEIGDIFASSAATGVVNNQDLMQFATRGLNAAAALGKQLHLTEAQVHEMASNGELDFKTFADAIDKAFGKHATEANQTYTGSLANMRAAFSRLGASFIGPHLEQQRDLFNAITPVIDEVAAALLPLINDFLVLKRINVNKIIDFLGNLDISSFQKGIGNVAVGLVNLYKALKPVGNAIKAAFNEIFSGSAGKGFISITSSFKDFTEKIKIGADTITRIKSAFKGFFAAIEIGFTIVKEVIKTIGAVIHALIPAGDGLLSFSSNTGDFITKLNQALVAGGGIERFFDRLRDVITHPIDSIIALKDAFIDFFHGIDFASKGPIKFLQDLRDKLFAFFNINVGNAAEKGLGRVGQRLEQVHNIFETVQNAFSKVHDFLKPVLDYMTHWLKTLGHRLAAAFHPGDFKALLDVLNVGLLGGIVVLLRKFLNQGLKLDFTGGVLNKLQGAFDQLTNTLKAMQTQLKAQALEKIAIAIAILTASLVVLSLIDSVALTKALTALAISFGQLIGALTLLDRVNLNASVVKLNGIAVAMILIAGATVILSLAIKLLSTIKLGDLAKGLAAVGVGLGLLVSATRGITADTGGLIAAGIAMGVIGVAINILAFAVKRFANMPAGELAKGLTAVGIAMTGLVASTRLIASDTDGLIAAGLAMITMGIALGVLQRVVQTFANMKVGDMAKGFGAVAVALAILIGALRFITIDTAGLISAAAAMVGIAVALRILTGVIVELGAQNIGTLAKGIIAFGLALLILVAGLNAMDGALAGAAALVVASVGLRIITEVLEKLGKLSIAQIVTGLVAIAAALVILAVASAAVSEAIPAMLGVGLALSLIGVSFALFGVGAIAVAKAFEIMAESGKAGAQGIVDAIKVLVTAIPQIEKAVFDFAVRFAKDILKAAPLLVRLFQALLEQMLQTMVELAPQFAHTIGVLIDNLVVLVHNKSPEFIQAGFELLENFLIGIRDNIGEITDTVADIIVNFLDALTAREPDIVAAAAHMIVVFLTELGNHAAELTAAGATMIIKFINGITQNLVRINTAVVQLITKFVTTMANNATKFVNAGVTALTNFLKGIGDNLVKVTNTVGDVVTRFVTAVGENATKILEAGTTALLKFLDGLKSRGPKVVKAFSDTAVALLGSLAEQFGIAVPKVLGKFATSVITMINGIADVIRENSKPMGEAWANVAEAMVSGFGNAFVSAMLKLIKDEVPKPLRGIVETALGIFGIHSPSKVFFGIGENVVKGLSLGLASFSPSKEFERVGRTVPQGLISGINSMNHEVRLSSFKLASEVIDSFTIKDINPTITPVLDLTKLQKDAGGISKVLGTSSFAQASLISHTHDADRQATTPTEPSVTTLTFEQNNYSPTALSTNDIYRNTKSQFALAKEKLSIS